MRRIALVAAVLAGLAGGAVAAPSAGAQCGFVVVWHDRAYWGFQGGPIQANPGGTALDGAVQPGCNDTAGANEGPTHVAARSIPGIPPAVAIVAEGQSLVGWGYYVIEAERDEARGCTLGGPVRITGRAHIGVGLLDVFVDHSSVHLHHLSGGAAQIFPDGHTRFEGLTRNGSPYIGEGQRVRIDARFCKVPGSEGTKIVARRIVPAGPIVAPSTAEDVLGADWRGRPGIASRATGGHALAAAIVLLLAAVGIGTALAAHRRRSLPPGTG